MSMLNRVVAGIRQIWMRGGGCGGGRGYAGRPGAGARSMALEALEGRIQLSAAPPYPGEPADQGAGDGTDMHATAQPLLPDLIAWGNRRRGYIHEWRIDRRELPGRTLLRLTTAIANKGPGPLDLRAARKGGEQGQQPVYQRIYDSEGEFTDHLAGRFTYHPTHHHTHFDEFAAYRLRRVRSNGTVGKVVRAAEKISFCLVDSDTYDLSLPNASKDGSYYSCSSRKQGISVGWADVYGKSLPSQWIDVTRVRPGRYWLEVEVDPANRIRESDETNNVTRILITLDVATRPENDDFEKRTELIGKRARARVSNENASRQKGEPRHAGGRGGASVWWTWTAPRSGLVTISTAGSRIDTVLAVYTGKRLDGLKRVASNDNAEVDTLASSVSFEAVAGKRYQIAVDGYVGAEGLIKLRIF